MANFTPAVFGEDKDAKKLGNEVTKVDDYTIKIRQSAKNALFLHVFMFLVHTFMIKKQC